jgi:threonine aldolase
MISFKNDYSEGAHPRILKTLMETNLEQAEGYGLDRFCLEAAELIRQRMGGEDVDIHFLSGGTQTNLIAISSFLKPHEAAIAAQTGHIFVHEAGAIESTGHKVLSVISRDGKLTPEKIQPVLDFHTDEHMVKPRLVYLSNPTELGTVYSRQELAELRSFCDDRGLVLYVDGARLGSALCVPETGLDLAGMAQLTDAFYIGGTKCGALIGEALVIRPPSLKQDFRFHLKQKGALLSKGRLLGIQFLELFRDDLYFLLARHANRMAGLLKNALEAFGFGFLTDSPTNQIFPILPDRLIDALKNNFDFYVWSRVDERHSSIRLVTSWATREEDVAALIKEIEKGRDLK